MHHWLERNQYLGLEVIGLLSEQKEDVADDPLPTLGRPCDLPAFLGQPGTMMVIVVEFSQNNDLLQFTTLCEERGVRLLVVADLDRFFGQPLMVFEDGGTFFLGLRDEPLQDPVNRFLKRGLDICVSLPVVVFVLPVLAFCTWIGQRLQSPGPLFYRQFREGLYNHPFTIVKLRTMHMGNSNNLSLPKSKEDPRLYPMGSFLRKSSLDEMVQFLNVLLGNMSIVGPRPHLPAYNDQYRRIYQRAGLVLLPETVEQIPEYLRNVVSGRPLPQAVIEEIQHRYSLIGRSPLTEITLEQGRLVEAELAAGGQAVPVYVGMRNWKPYIPDVVRQMRADGVEEAAVICMAPQNSRTSVGLYRRAVEAEAGGLQIDFTPGWAHHPLLIEAFAERLRPALSRLSAEVGTPVPVLKHTN